VRGSLFILVLGLAGLVVPEASWADQITLQCKLLSGANATYGQVDQFVIDPENNSAELRVARTMGTNDEEMWNFVTQKTGGTDDRFTVKSFAPSQDANPADGPIYGGGVRGASGTALRLVKGVLTWTSLQEDKIITMSWRCH
jgi:hypothetical protein